MSLDDAITNLHQMVKTHMANVEPNVAVFDGQPVEDAPFEAIAIGMTAEDLATDGTIDDAGLYSVEESYDINCMIRCWSGGTDLVVLRKRAVHLYKIVKAQIGADLTLRGAVTRARVASLAYSPARLPDGTVVNMTFRVRCRTLTS